jgi:hypothetical protein
MNLEYTVEQQDRIKLIADRYLTGHTIHTPWKLVEETLEQVNTKNTHVAVLYNVEFVFALIAKFKHPAEQVTFFGDCDKKRKLVEGWGCNYIDVSKLKDCIMKFDVVLANPPYQDALTPSRKLWVEIIIKSFELVRPTGTLCMITPNSWILRPDGQKFKKISQLFAKYQLKFVDLITPNNYFTVGEDIGYWILEKKLKYQNTTIHAKWNDLVECKEINFSGERLEFSDSEKLKSSIIKKVLNSSKERMPFESELSSDRGIDQLITDGVISKTQTKKFSQELFWTASQIYYTTDKISKSGIRLVLNRSGYFFQKDQIDKYMPIKQDIAIGIGGYGLSFKSKKEAEHARNLLSSKIIRLFVEGQKTSGFNTALTKLPKFDLTMPIENLVKYFNLTPDEIKYLESNVE